MERSWAPAAVPVCWDAAAAADDVVDAGSRVAEGWAAVAAAVAAVVGPGRAEAERLWLPEYLSLGVGLEGHWVVVAGQLAER